jgi:signal transduction histidine kinase
MLLVPAATVVLAVLVGLLVGRTLRPVSRIRSEVDAIGLDELDRRVPQPPGHDEIARLAATMNAMLERLDRANQRQQRFVADASHELRTPLTRMRAELELEELDPTGAATASTRRHLLDDVARLQQLIDDLLVLALPRRPVDLDDLVLDEARAAGAVDVRNVSAAQVRGDATSLRRAVRNLLDNACRHASSRVEVTLYEADGCVHLIVDDDGAGIPPESRAVVFERFARLDDARTPTEGRSGLGLSIVQAVVARRGGTVAATDSPLGGARLTVILPTSMPDSSG